MTRWVRPRRLRCRLHWHSYALRTNPDGETYRECSFCHVDREVFDLIGSVKLPTDTGGLTLRLDRAGRRTT